MQLESMLQCFAKYIESQLGIVYAEHNYYQLQNRLEEISKLLGIESIEKLYIHAQSGIDGQFKQLLLDLATNNETSFFRDPKVFKAIESLVIPDFLKSEAANTEFKIWSAASSTGQEALSLAMLIEELSAKMGKVFPYSITGTDISERILARAKEANYSQLEVQRGLSATHLVKFFTKNSQDRWSPSVVLTKHIQFKKQNLLEPFSFPYKFNLILCRNVLIYQPIKNKIEILSRISKLLAPGGILILGSGESLLGLSNEYQQVPSEGAVIYLKKEPLAQVA